jgi:hypothetical protein
VGRTALYRDPAPFHPARAEVELDGDAVVLAMPDGRQRRYALDGCTATQVDGVVTASIDARPQRRFVRMLVLDGRHERHVIITPPDRGALAPNVVRLPEAPDQAAIVDDAAWDALAEWVIGGGRLAAWSIADLARLAAIASLPFAVVIGEVAAQRALEQLWGAVGPLRGDDDLDAALQPLAAAALGSPRVAAALVAARALAVAAVRSPRMAEALVAARRERRP